MGGGGAPELRPLDGMLEEADMFVGCRVTHIHARTGKRTKTHARRHTHTHTKKRTGHAHTHTHTCRARTDKHTHTQPMKNRLTLYRNPGERNNRGSFLFCHCRRQAARVDPVLRVRMLLPVPVRGAIV